MIAPSLPSPSGTSIRSGRHVPLLSLAPPALALGDGLAVGEPGEDNNVGGIWNVITRAADLVKDGERLENLAWRHWGQPRRTSPSPTTPTTSSLADPTTSTSSSHRRLSMSSQGSASSASLHTPVEPSYFPRTERRTFGGALKLLLEKDEDNFKDWVEDARRDRAVSPGVGAGAGAGARGKAEGGLPTLSVPDTPVATHVEIRLVEPTPVPSRDGSLGGSVNVAGLMMAARESVSPGLPLREVAEEADEGRVGAAGRSGAAKDKGKSVRVSPAPTSAPASAQPQTQSPETQTSTRTHPSTRGLSGPAPIQTGGISRARSSSPKRKGKFFVQSSPSKGSGSDSSHLSPVAVERPAHQAFPAPAVAAASASAGGSGVTTVTNTATTTPTAVASSKLPTPTPTTSALPTTPTPAPALAPAPSSSTLSKPPPLPRRQSSGDSSGAHKSAPHHSQKRHVSLTAMRGKFHAEKRRVADAIVKKDEREKEKEREARHDHKAGENEESGWEDEDEDEDEEDWSDEDGEGEGDSNGGEDGEENGDAGNEEDDEWEEEEDEGEGGSAIVAEPEQITSPSPERAPHRAKDPSRRRSSSRPRPGRTTTSTADLTALLARRISWHGDRDAAAANTTPSKNMPAPPAPTPLTKMSKKERQAAAAERAKIEARLDAQRKREMFAKQQIFGKGPAQGLLASALQRGASMVNLPSAAENPAIRPSPTHVQLTSLAQSPRQVPSLLRSKSAVAMPVQTGVSVTIPPHAAHLSKAGPGAKHAQSSSHESQERAKAGVELESEEESEDDDSNYLNTTQTRQKIAEMAVRREAKEKAKAAQAQVQGPVEGTAAAAAAVVVEGAGGAGPVVPVALPVHQRVNEYGVVQPMTPTTRRRNIIMAEMSESLRRNVVLEREKSSGGLSRVLTGAAPRARPPPSTNISAYPSHRSAINLTQYAQSQPLERHSSHDPSRTPYNSHDPHHTPYGAAADAAAGGGRPGAGMHAKSLSGAGVQQGSSSHAQTQQQQQHAPAPSRRPQPSVLSGGIRPLTRVGDVSSGGPGRTQSSVTLGATASAASSSAAPGSVGASSSAAGAGAEGAKAPAMVRWATEGGEPTQREKERKEWKEWSRRSVLDTSYRSHGW
ncbi:hypothetical protein IAT38_000452 [Cryptococcus sp. DSM 104549]